MCRWMAYKGKETYIDEWLLNSEHSLIEQSKSADMTKYEVNGDGFGLGWYGKKPTPGLFKSIRPAWNNTNLKSLAENVSSSLFLAHVRAATGTPIQETNSHPFQFENWLMVHNGLIHEFATIKKELLELIEPQFFLHILGSTDSEVLFFLLLSNGLRKDLNQAINITISQIEKIAGQHGISPSLRMTLGISDGDSLWCVRYSTRCDSSTLFYSIQEHQKKAQVLVVSEPIDQDSLSWHAVPENTVMCFDTYNQTYTQQIESR